MDVSALAELDLEPVGELLEAGEPTARASAATLLSYLAEDDPTVIDPFEAQLRELATADEPFLRESAVWCLATRSDEDTHDLLTRLAREDPEEAVRRSAAAAVAPDQD